MTAQGEDILAWLDNAISVRAAAATGAAVPYGGHWVQGFPEQHKDPDMRYGWDQDMVHLSQDDPHIAYQCLSDEIAAHTVLNDPESVLRRCAADRKLLESHQPTSGIGYEPDADSTPGAYGDIARACSSCGTPNEYAVRFPCHVVRLLAEGYGWTGASDER